MSWRFVPKQLQQARERLELKPGSLASRLSPSMSGAQIRDFETGRRSPTIRTFLKLCNGLGLSPYQFFVNGTGVTGRSRSTKRDGPGREDPGPSIPHRRQRRRV